MNDAILEEENKQMNIQMSIQIIFTLINAFVVPAILGKVWTRGKNYNWFTFILPIILQITLLITQQNDMQLITIYNLDGGVALPYGLIWFLLNPLWGTPHLYLVYIVTWSLGFLGVMAWLVQKKRLTARWVFWSQMLNVSLLLIHNPQSIVPMTFIYLVPAIGISGFVIAGLIKLPFGWSFPIWNNLHWKCAFGVRGTEGFQYFECQHFSINYALTNPNAWYNYTVYLVIIGWAYWAFKLWKNKRPYRAIIAKWLLQTRLFFPLRIYLLQKLHLFERPVVDIIKNHAPGNIFIDVGSANGYYAKLAKKNFRQIYTIDPNGEADFKCALGNKNGVGHYHRISYEPAKMARMLRFDTLFGYADLVKIDVEGAEFEVLEGMGNVIVKEMIIELHDLTRIDDLRAVLPNLYNIYRIDKRHFYAIYKFS